MQKTLNRGVKEFLKKILRLKLTKSQLLLVFSILLFIVFAFLLRVSLSSLNFNDPKFSSLHVKNLIGGNFKLKKFFKQAQENQKRDLKLLSYHNVEEPIYESFIGNKLIHLDLKGAPPLLSYYKNFFPYIKNLGATGLLIEYEDMFPYRDGLEEIRADNAYTPSDIKSILNMAKENNLNVIPLVQTFGHLEFVLKLQNFRDLREIDIYPQVPCPNHDKTKDLIQEMIRQVLLYHPQAKYIHLGCDEVYHLGLCSRCFEMMKKKNWNRNYLFLNHVESIVAHVNKTYPGIRPILWGDMFAKIDAKIIDQFDIKNKADVMIWSYTTNVSDDITDELLEFYAALFKYVWFASAFKGTTGVNEFVTNAKYHLSNQISWVNILSKWKGSINFKGIALTGWQRYDHFSVLCEFLPVAIPSLTLSLMYLQGVDKNFDETRLLEVLRCDSSIPLSPKDILNLPMPKCDFPGYNLFRVINRFYRFTQIFKHPKSSSTKGWFTVYNVVNKFSSPLRVESFMTEWPFEQFLKKLETLERVITKELREVYDQYTVEEWILTYIMPFKIRLKVYFYSAEALLQQAVWPRRPMLNGTETLESALNKICSFNTKFGCGLLLT